MTILAIGTWQIAIIVLVLLFPVVALVSALKNDFPGNEKLIWGPLICLRDPYGQLSERRNGGLPTVSCLLECALAFYFIYPIQFPLLSR
jgi:hypothetical protein